MKKQAHPSETTSTDSLWAATAKETDYAPLHRDATADVCVVGAGIAGVTTAYLLAKAGKSVVLLDDGPVGGGQTVMTSAHLASAIDDRYVEVERLHGLETARLAAESHAAAIDQIEAIVSDEHLECDFQRVEGYLFAPPNESTDLLVRELEAVRRTGALEVAFDDRAPWPDFDTGPCLRFARQAQFHPLKYLNGLARAIRDMKGNIYCGTHVQSVEGGEQAHVETSGGHSVTAEHLVVATNTPINDMYAMHTKQAPYMTYVIGARIPRDAIPNALYWDTGDPYHYVRVQRGADKSAHDILIVGGEDHKTGQAHDGAARFANLETWARKRVPALGETEFRWAGQVMETLDGLAFIGRNPSDHPNVYIATGDSGMGLTHGTIAGILLADLIQGRQNPWQEIYDPARKPAGAVARFAKENLNVAAQYTTWLTPGELSDTDELAPGQGAIMRRGLTKVAVYRDKAGHLCELSAVCPHLQCVVAWNAVESTWDCPCHGSRFDPQGHVLNGPANVDLPSADEDE